ncbi:hypothetical protein P886_1458 [Alteromonadaceae bacterium 2753L.S.0a.02]|nr:hypothetical protein P886_1458 [Alteromonadaceae bacterium 2753L.S.0a.02]
MTKVGGRVGLVGGGAYLGHSLLLDYSDSYRDATVGSVSNVFCAMDSGCL